MKIFLTHTNVIVCEAKTSKEMNRQMFRFMEFSASEFKQELQEEVFTMQQAAALYRGKYGEDVEFPPDICGCNLFAVDINKFYRMYPEDMLTKFELRLKRYLSKGGFLQPKQRYHIIGVVHGDNATIAHELSHVFFDKFPVYKKRMIGYINHLNEYTRNKVEAVIIKEYKEAKEITYNIQTEIQAYLATGNLHDIINYFELLPNEVDWVTIHKMQKFFHKYRSKVAYQHFD